MLHPRAFGDRIGHRHGAGIGQRRAQRIGVGGFAQQVDAQIGADRPRVDPGDLHRDVGVLGVGEAVAAPADVAGRGAEQRQQAALHRALVKLDPITDAEAADHVEQLLKRRPLGVEQQLIAGVQDPKVAQHLALRGEERRVAAISGD